MTLREALFPFIVYFVIISYLIVLFPFYVLSSFKVRKQHQEMEARTKSEINYTIDDVGDEES